MVLTHDSPYLWNRLDTLAMGGLLLFGFLLRLPNLVAPYVINTDAIKYVQAANLIAQGKFWEGIQITGPSVYPVLISLLYPLIGDFVTAARILTVSFGILTLVPFYLLAREIFDRSTAWISCFFYCLSPSILRTSMDVVRDPLFWFVFACFLWLLVKASREGRSSLYVAAGFIACLSMSIRLNGLLLLPIGVGFGLYQGILHHQRLNGLLNALCVLFPVAMIALLFVIPILGRYGTLELKNWKSYQTQAKIALMRTDELEPHMEKIIMKTQPRTLKRFLSIAWDTRDAVLGWYLLDHLIHAAYPPLFFLMVLGVFQKRAWSDSRWHLLALIIMAWIFMGSIRTWAVLAISKRHLIPLTMAGYLYGTLGFCSVRAFLSSRWSRLSRGAWTLILVVVLVLITAPESFKSSRQDKLARRQAGEWIRSLGISDAIVVTDRPRIGFYADADPVNARNLQKAKKIHHRVFLILPASTDRKGFQKKVKPIINASSNRAVFFAYSEDVEGPFLKGKVSTLFSPRWHLVQTKAFQNAKESIMVYQFERH